MKTAIIYYSKHHENTKQLLDSISAKHEVTLIDSSQTKAIESVVSKKSAKIKGSFGCFGFNTFGPFKLIGGIAKGHPNKNDMDHAVQFFDHIIKDF